MKLLGYGLLCGGGILTAMLIIWCFVYILSKLFEVLTK